MRPRALALVAALLGVLAVAVPSRARNLPARIEENCGQVDGPWDFVARAGGYFALVSAVEARLVLPAAGVSEVLGLRLVGASADARPAAEDELGGTSRYFVGSRRLADVRTYARVRYAGVYPGIDLVFRTVGSDLEYDFHVGPGADREAIRLAIDGADVLDIDASGELLARTASGVVAQRLRVFQEAGGEPCEVSGRFVHRGGNEVGFDVGLHDPARPLVIDPLLRYSSFLGGGGGDGGMGIALDLAGNVIVTGQTLSLDFPTRFPWQPTSNTSDAFIAKLTPDGSDLIFSTYLGGASGDVGTEVAIDGAGDIYVAGSTQSVDFPVTAGAFQVVGDGSNYDGFIARLTADGSRLVYATYLGGHDGRFAAEGLSSIAVSPDGYVVAVGETAASNFPLKNPLQGWQGGYDGLVTKLSPDGTAAVFSTYLGGAGDDAVHDVALDAAGNVYLTGNTNSPGFPVAGSPLQSSNRGVDAFVTKLDPTGQSILYSTFLGGSGQDLGRSIALDAAGDFVVLGQTASLDFPTVGALQDRNRGLEDAFLCAIDPAGSRLLFSTYLGGSGADYPHDLALAANGDAVLVGLTESTDFPLAAPVQPVHAPDRYDGFVSRVTPGAALRFSSYLGGGGEEWLTGVATAGVGDAWVTGFTRKGDFPVVRALQPQFGGGSGDAVLLRIDTSICPPRASAPGVTVCKGATARLEGEAAGPCAPFGYAFHWLEGSTERCPWSASPVCDVSPAATTDYTLEVSCAVDPPCIDRATVTVSVDADLAPADLGNTLRAVRSGGAVVLAWGTDPLARSHALYRVDRKDDRTSPPVARALAAPAATLPDVPPPSPYFYRAVGESCSGKLGP